MSDLKRSAKNMKLALILIGLLGFAIAGHSIRAGVNVTRPSMSVARAIIEERTKSEPLTEKQWKEVDLGLSEAHRLAKSEKFDIGKSEAIVFRGLLLISSACIAIGIFTKKPRK